MDETEKQDDYMTAVKGFSAGKKAFINTFGCQMNEHDSETLRGMLEKMGYEKAAGYEDSDLVVFNTCCVRESAEAKVFGHLGALKGLKHLKPNLIIALCGCMAGEPDAVEKIGKKYKNVDIIFDTKSIYLFPQLLYEKITERGRQIFTGEGSEKIIEGLPVERECKFKAWVTIMYGCNNFCTYCIVPYVRGRERSRRSGDILKEITELEKEGVKEITLLGQNVNSYGNGIEEELNFAGLLNEICLKTEIPRIRFMTSHPKDLSDELIEVMAKNPRICRHLHLPIQSGSTKILKAMNRKYTAEEYFNLVMRVKKAMPDIVLSTDVIVGFPGETESDFEDTLEMVRKVEFDSAYTFIYSERKGTPAAKLDGKLPDAVVKDRFDRLLELQNNICRVKNEAMSGKVFRVLVEGLSKNDPKRYTGRTGGNKIVNFDSERDLTGEFAEIKITEAKSWSLFGEPVIL